MTAYQYQHWLVCQKCGRCVPRGTDEWLDEPWKKNPEYRVVRCPIHWSEWALRNSVGRSNWHREQMYLLKAKYAHWPDQSPAQTLPLYDEPTE